MIHVERRSDDVAVQILHYCYCFHKERFLTAGIVGPSGPLYDGSESWRGEYTSMGKQGKWLIPIVGPLGPLDQRSGPGILKGTHGRPW